jgi:hypothetical protein
VPASGLAQQTLLAAMAAMWLQPVGRLQRLDSRILWTHNDSQQHTQQQDT